MYDTGFMILFVVLMFASVAGLIVLSLLLFRGTSSSNQAQQNDVTNMMILFQTMRDLLSEQKELARQFNHSIDQKVSEVRSLLESRDEVQRLLLEAKRDIAQLTEDTRRDLAGIRRHAGSSETVEADPEAAAPMPSEQPKDPSESTPKKELGGNGTHASSLEGNGSVPLRAIPEPPPVPKRDFIDAWTGVDFGTPPAPDEDEPARIADEVDVVDDAATREAYRSLLNVHSGDDESPAPDPFHPESNEIRNELTPIQMRVYEYADAGMRVPEIARELGVGKGEVRLILSLRKGQRR